ncbi:MAG: hypothetical protein K6C96_03655 [Butyrivibrio sp.]|nr:hypothetical protein [Butyrivibrio sp.]
MKPANVKSRMLKRLIPVLLVPVVLSSNFAAINVSADEETVIEANSQNETIENETPAAEETPAVEETPAEEEAPAEEVVPAEGENLSQEQTPAEENVTEGEPVVTAPEGEAPAETVAPAEGEPEEVEETEEETEELEGEEEEEETEEESEEETSGVKLLGRGRWNPEPEYVSVTFDGNDAASEGVYVSFTDEEDAAVEMAFGEPVDVFAGYEDDDAASISLSISVKEHYSLTKVTFNGVNYGTSEIIEVSGNDLSDDNTLYVEAKKDDGKDPEVTGVTLTGTAATDSGLTFIPVTAASDAVLTVTAKDEAESAVAPSSGIAGAEVVINGTAVDMRKEQNDDGTVTFTWSPREGAYRVYEIGEITVKDNCNNDVKKNASEYLTADKICYYNPEAPVSLSLDTNSTSKASDAWFNINDNARRAEYDIVFTGKSVAPVDEITAVAADGSVHTLTSELSCNYNAGMRAFYVVAKFSVDKTQVSEESTALGNGISNFTFMAKRYGDTEAKKIGEHIVKIDLTDIDASPLNPVFDEENRAAFLTIPAQWNNPLESGLESGTVSYKYTGQKIVTTHYQFLWWGWDEEDVVEFTEDFDPVTLNLEVDGENVIYDAEADSVTTKCAFEDIKTDKSKVIYGKYQIQSLTLKDKAGNSYETICATNEKSWGIFRPIITQRYLAEEVKPKVNDIVFFNKDIEGEMNIYDTDLDKVRFTALDTDPLLGDSVVPDQLENKDELIEGKQIAGTPIKKYKYAFTLDEGEYYFKTWAIDKAKNDNELDSYKIVVDKTAPVVSVSYNGQDTPAKYYNAKDGQVNVKLTVTEKWMDFENSYVEVVGVTEDGSDGTINSKNLYSSAENFGWSGKVGDLTHELTIPVTVDGTYHVKYVVKDLAENGGDLVELEAEFILDTKSPEVLEYKFTGPEARNGKYYNDTRTLTVVVKDLTFDTASKAVINQEYGTAKQSDWEETGAYTFTKTIEFKEDGIYSFVLTLKDLAGNAPTVKEETEFFIDKTAPKIAVYYDNNNAKNGFYYKDARLATVDIEDLSFTGDMVSVRQTDTEDPGAMPSLGGFSSSGMKNTAQMLFADDGSYAYVINCEDLAGNQAEAFTADMFVIDRTIPEVKFSGVENFSANNGTVAPAVSYVDKHMDIEASYISMTGSNNGAVNLANTVDRTENGFVVSYSDFEHVKGMDDLYILKAHVLDLAGNENEDELVFSVNRFGSVFVLGEATKLLNEQYYTKEPIDVSITEINVDELTQKTVSISRDGDIKELKSGRQYNVAKQGSDTSWKTYTYTVSRDNFGKDGIYSVTIYTKDRATNVQDNKSRDAEVNFAVDKTAPSIVTAGLKEGEVYKETSHTVNIDVTDNMGVTNLTVFKDGKEVDTYDEEQLAADNGVESITLSESDNKQALKFVAEDVAGNVTTVEFNDILVSTKETEILPVASDSEGTMEAESEVLGEKRERSAIGFIILALGVVAAGAGAGVTLYKKKQNSASEN